MKTDTETLRKRGFLTNTEAEPYFLYSKEELLELLKDKTAVNRTAALFILRSFVDINELDEILLRMLVKEKALYTKLEICDILTTGNELTIKRMIPYMVSKKKSYPLPRDIIARTMAKMNPDYFSTILEIINYPEDKVVAEAIDAIGWMVFYHQELATAKNYQTVIQLFERYHDNELMKWKLIICLSAFNQSEAFLKQLDFQNPVVQAEIERSLSLINKRKSKVVY